MMQPKLSRIDDEVVLRREDTLVTRESSVRGNLRNLFILSTDETTTSNKRVTRRGGKPVRPLARRFVISQNRSPTAYVLRGFDCSFLDSRRITFGQPLPNVCVSCSVLPARALLLPCDHTVCEVCKCDTFDRAERAADQDDSAVGTLRNGVCPKDGVPFADSCLEVLTTSLEQVHSQLALCVNASLGCPFRAELRHLKEHYFYDCRFSPRSCNHCGRYDIPACDILRHSLSCARW
ncbi:hypothetical protein HPB49_019081 [Dermacentor silvarum]|uniref:Uncharacterized protein n=1 Tax=Dermacentor silvarum TaxID=543639 RepID=A0ACB8D7L6_DERSI|nr:hypothetical protein HPB49_019081 [Dermacentor silvarum]